MGDQRVGDGWTQDAIEWSVEDVAVRDGESSAELEARVLWTSNRYTDEAGRPVPFVEEWMTIRVYPTEASYREIDIAISLRALVDSVRIGGSEDEKGYGGFCARIRLPEDVRFVGVDGPVEPQVTAVEAGPWLDVSGTYRGRMDGTGLSSKANNRTDWLNIRTF